MQFLTTALLLIATLAIVTLGIFLCFWIIASIRTFIFKDAPFVPTRNAIIPDILTALALEGNAILYEPGCGDASILRAAIFQNPLIYKGVGIEYNMFPYLLARHATQGLPISIYKKDMYTIDYSKATHIYCYLFPHVLAKLEPIFIQQCAKGTRIVSCDYTFPTLIPKKTIDLSAKSYQLGKKLYVYEL